MLNLLSSIDKPKWRSVKYYFRESLF